MCIVINGIRNKETFKRCLLPGMVNVLKESWWTLRNPQKYVHDSQWSGIFEQPWDVDRIKRIFFFFVFFYDCNYCRNLHPMLCHCCRIKMKEVSSAGVF